MTTHPLRVMARFAKWAGLFLVALLIGLLALNAFDQRPLPGVVALRASAAAALQADDSGDGAYYAAAFGADTPDIEAMGRQRIATLHEIEASNLPLTAPARFDPFAGQKKFNWNGSTVRLPSALDFAASLLLARDKPDIVADLLTKDAEALRRYDALKQFPRLTNRSPHTATADLLGIDWDGIGSAMRLWNLSAAQQFEAKQFDVLIDALLDDNRYWRHTLAGPGLRLVGKMMATTRVKAQLLMASDLLRSRALSPAQIAALRPLAAPLSTQERTLDDELRHEFLWLDAMLGKQFSESMLDVPDESGQISIWARMKARLLGRFYLREATANLLYEQIQLAMADDRRPCSEYPARTEQQTPWWAWAYNPVGHMLVFISSGTFRSYGGRMCDLVGFQRVFALQLHIAGQAVPDTEIPDLLRDAGAELSDPFNGQPMRWLPESQALSFDAVDQRDREIFLPWKIGALEQSAP